LTTDSMGRVPIDKLCQQFVNLVEKALIGQALAKTANGELSRAQYEGLRFVHLHPGCCIKDLAKGLSVSHPAAVKLVERLGGKAYIAREVRDEDRRVVRLTSTPEGTGLIAEVGRRRDEAFATILGAMETAEVEKLAECVDSFIRNALQQGVAGGKMCLHCGVEHRDECPIAEAQGVA